MFKKVALSMLKFGSRRLAGKVKKKHYLKVSEYDQEIP